MTNREDQPWTNPSGDAQVPHAEVPNAPIPPSGASGPPTTPGWGAPFPPPPGAGQSAQPSQTVPGEEPTGSWAPPTEPHRTQNYDQPWTPIPGPVASTTPKSSGGKGGSIGKWIAVAAVSALIGGGVGAAVVDNDDNASGATTVTTVSSSSNQQISAPATPSSIRNVLEKVQPAVVTVQAEGNTTSGSGTGMIVTSDGYILTNAHVVRGSTSIRVTLNESKNAIDAKLLGMDSSIDAAVIKIDPSSALPSVELGDSGQLQVGDEVVAIGNALALAGGPSVTTGIVSAKDREISDGSQTLNNLIQTDAAINPGNSGGPLVNMAGQVIGMNTAVIRGQEGEFQNIGFAMAVNTIKPAIEDLKAGKVQQQALLGVSAVTLVDDIRDRYNLEPQSGAVVDSVTPGGPADRAGLSRFDVITRIDDEEIDSSDELTAEVRSHRPNDKVKITYFRGDDERTVEVTLGARPVNG